MRVVFRTDASATIGIGHLMRCLTLASELQKNGCEITFIFRELSDSLVALVQGRGFEPIMLPGRLPGRFDCRRDAAATIECIDEKPVRVDWLVVDHYEIDRSWESRLRSRAEKIMVIDDLANRAHDCDLLLDQNYYRDQDRRYGGLLPAACAKLLGPEYVLLRPEFLQARARLRQRDGVIRRILVFFGGGDLGNQTLPAIEAIKALARADIVTDVVVGASNQNSAAVKAVCEATPNMNFHHQIENMAELMASADLALIAGGSTTWERCFLGLPAITVVVADNQEQTAIDVAHQEAGLYLGWADKLTSDDYLDAMRYLISRPGKMLEMGVNALRLMGGDNYKGCAAVACRMLRG